MKQIKADIKNKEYKPIYLLTGEEGFLVHSYKKQLVASMMGDDSMNLTSYSGQDIDVDLVIDAADTLPFLADYKVITIDESGWCKGASPEKLIEYLDVMPDTTHIIMTERDVDKRNKLYKKISKVGYVADMKHPTSSELTTWCAAILKKAGKKITAGTLSTMLTYVGDDMSLVKNELDKLIDYVGDRDVIELKDVDSITTITVENRIFDMVQAITTRRTASAMNMYEDLVVLKEAPMRIMFLIAKQFNQLLQVKDMVAAHIDKKDIAADLKIPVFVVDKLTAQVRNYDKKKLESYVRSCVELEEAVKTGDMPERLAVELLITGAV